MDREDSPRVLLVEDHPVNQKVASLMLRLLGYRVVIANHGEEALGLLQEEVFDGVLMDVQMPVMDGVEATTAIRSHLDPQVSNIPVVAVTAQAMEGDRQRCLGAGANAYLTKPIDRAQLEATLAELISAD
jgi:CheY-like chemotaxis protein